MTVEVTPGLKTANLGLTITPAGVSCTAMVGLSPVGTQGVDSIQSALVPFTSSSAQQTVPVPVTFPDEAIEWLPTIDIVLDGTITQGYYATENVMVTPSGLTLQYSGSFAWDVYIMSVGGARDYGDITGLKNPATADQRAAGVYPSVRFTTKTSPFAVWFNEWGVLAGYSFNYWYGPYQVTGVTQGKYSVGGSGITGATQIDLANTSYAFTGVVISIEYTGGDWEGSETWGAVVQVTSGSGIFQYMLGATFMIDAGGGEQVPEYLIGHSASGTAYLQRVNTGSSYVYTWVLNSGGIQ